MQSIKVILEDGDYFFTKINAPEATAKKYYIGKYFNVGCTVDNLKKCTKIEFLK